jgi:hypothetical protein
MSVIVSYLLCALNSQPLIAYICSAALFIYIALAYRFVENMYIEHAMPFYFGS